MIWGKHLQAWHMREEQNRCVFEAAGLNEQQCKLDEQGFSWHRALVPAEVLPVRCDTSGAGRRFAACRSCRKRGVWMRHVECKVSTWSELPTVSLLHSSGYFNLKISTLEDDRGDRLHLTIIRRAKTMGFLNGNIGSSLKGNSWACV